MPEQPEMLAAALAYAEAGLEVFPLQPNSKIPIKGGRGFKDATTDTAMIKHWWSTVPGANIGLRPPAGFIVIDVDVHRDKRGDEALTELESRFGEIERHLVARTASGGLHIWARMPDGSEPPGAPAAHIDVKTRAGYVVAPPSVIDGKRYSWIEGLGS